ncbi:MAG: hypothetical protein JF630_17845, partial [Geodermatophilales bacterium]|nr:hypothetical protein [Geodermatophilales bacterium]
MQEGLSIPLTPDTAASADLGDFLEESRVTRGRLLRGGALFGISQFLGMALGFGSGIVLVRVADKPAVASYMLLQQAILSVGLVMQLGLGPAALRFVPVCRGRGGAASTSLLRRRLFAIQIILWAVIVPLLALAWPLIARRLDAPELAKATGFLVAAAVLSSFGNLVDSYLRSFRL